MISTDDPTQRISPIARYVGFGLNWLLALAVAMGGVTDLVKPQFVIDGLTRAGYDEQIIVPLGVVVIGIALLYAIPRTAVLGAILITGYFGGAIATHVNQIGEPITDPIYPPMIMAFGFGVLVWVALWLRLPKLRAIAPIVK